MSHPRHEDRLFKQLPLTDVKLTTTSLKEIVMNSSVKIATRTPLAFSAAMLLACVWAVSTALAGEQVRSETVKFSDLNVSTSQGVQELYGRIHAAAWRVCATTSGDPFSQMGQRGCAKKAEGKAIDSLNLPQLTAFYRAKTGDHSQPLSANR
jgi:UrcA family protein